MNKLTDITKLAKYQPGDNAYWVVLRSKHSYTHQIAERDQWILDADVHPKTLYEYKILKGCWSPDIKLPKLHAVDFRSILSLITSDLLIEKFDISKIQRSKHTGEFYYSNKLGEWIPESNLFHTKKDAKIEQQRIKGMISKWARDT